MTKNFIHRVNELLLVQEMKLFLFGCLRQKTLHPLNKLLYFSLRNWSDSEIVFFTYEGNSRVFVVQKAMLFHQSLPLVLLEVFCFISHYLVNKQRIRLRMFSIKFCICLFICYLLLYLLKTKINKNVLK